MLTYAFVATLLAGAMAVPEPMITAPPMRRDFGDIGDSIDNALGDAKTFLGDTASKISDSAECVDKVEDIFDKDDNYPKADDGDLRAAITSHWIASGDNCVATSEIAPTLTSAWSSYESAFVEWYKDASTIIQDAADVCGDIPTTLRQRFEPCSTALEAAGVTPVVFGAAKDGGNNSTGTGENSAPRVAGLMAGAAGLFAAGAAVILL